MTNSYAYSATRKYFVISLAIALLTMLLTVVSTSPAFAACNGGQSDFGCEDGQGGSGGDGGNGTQPPATPGPSNPGTGTPGPPADPYLTVVRHVPAQGACPVDDGRNALGLDIFYTSIFEITNSKEVAPSSGGNWSWQGYFPGHGHSWAKKVEVGRDCLYPAKTYITTSICYISTTATVQMMAPRNETISSNTEVSGFGQGSTDYRACINSKSRASANANIQEDGFYVAEISSLAQIATIEVAYTPNELTGITPEEKIIGLSAVFETSPSRITGSLHCTTDWVSPATQLANYGDNSACEQSSNPNGFYRCVINNEPTLNGYGSGVQYMGDGSRNSLKFNQGVTGEGLIVDSWTTRFSVGDSTPFAPVNSADSGDINKYLTGIFRSENDASTSNLLKTNGQTPSQSGKLDEVFLTSYTANDMYGGRMNVTQTVTFTGSRLQQSVHIVAIEPGVIITEAITVRVPSSGPCSSEIVAVPLRAHGDKIG